MNLPGRAVLISGSADKKANRDDLDKAHRFIRSLTKACLDEGMDLVIGLGEDKPSNCGLPTDFDCSVLEAAKEYFEHHQSRLKPSIHVIRPQRPEPPNRRELWKQVRERNLVRDDPQTITASVNRRVREAQAALADAMFCMSGGAGVEQTAELFMQMRKPVIPFDLDLQSRNRDGFGGAALLSIVLGPNRDLYFEFADGVTLDPVSAYNQILLRSNASEDDAARKSAKFLSYLTLPTGFFVRLDDDTADRFKEVDRFFDQVVERVVGERGFRKVHIASGKGSEPFLAKRVFDGIHHAGVVIVDITGERPNCYAELGYALGRRKPTLITAREGTKLPFDINQIHVHRWTEDILKNDPNRALNEFRTSWDEAVGREPIVSPDQERILERLGVIDRNRNVAADAVPDQHP